MDDHAHDESCSHPTSMIEHIGHVSQCTLCKKRERELPEGTKLKLCTGCGVAKYCSKACQKAAWPQHRLLCRSTHERHPTGHNRFAGYGSPVALTQAISDWADGIHGHGLEALANATVLSHGGIAANLGSSVIKFSLARGPEAGGTGNPADEFRIKGVDVLDQDDVESMGCSWDYVKTESPKKARWFRRRIRDRTILGCIAAMSLVEDAEVMTFHFYPIYALQCGQTTALPRPIRTVCDDIAEMCIETINRGCVIIPSSCCARCQSGPDVCTMVKKRKNWELRRLEDWEWAPPDECNTRSGLHRSQVWALRAEM